MKTIDAVTISLGLEVLLERHLGITGVPVDDEIPKP